MATFVAMRLGYLSKILVKSVKYPFKNNLNYDNETKSWQWALALYQ